MTSPVVIHWFRRDLRLSDNPSLAAAVEAVRALDGGRLLLLYIHDDETPDKWRWGGAQRWWLDQSLRNLGQTIRERGNSLTLMQGKAADVIEKLCAAQPVKAVFWNRCYEPFAIERDKTIKQALKERGIETESFNGSLLNEPWTISTGTGDPYRVFTPYWRAVMAKGGIEPPLNAHKSLPPAPEVSSEDLNDWQLLPTRPDWASGIRASWTPGEPYAKDRLSRFLEGRITGYKSARDFPADHGTSRLSPHLHWGEISPRQIWHATIHHHGDLHEGGNSGPYLREVGWREFCYQLLFHNPTLPEQPLNPKFGGFPWARNDQHLEAWQRGRTGVPIVDAGMRELWQTGWMHNRVRMIVGSFLVKNLLLPWQEGQKWFWDTLVDGDLANNASGWQWIAGCGADAAPYFRVFNPVLQGQKFDRDGAYVRRYVPELGQLSDKYIHNPWEAPPAILQGAGIRLGTDYPKPVVDLKGSRERALDAFNKIKN
jgi:deoxyribodipyrimidine photo-lyase